MSSTYAASPAAACRTTSRFIRSGPAPIGRVESGGAEHQATGEPGLQLGFGPREEVAQLGLDVDVRLGLEPPGGHGTQAVASHGTRVRNETSGRGPTWLITSAAAIEPRRAHSVSGRALLYP